MHPIAPRIVMPLTDTVPYPWPYDGPAGLDPSRTALVVNGAQRRWADLDPVVTALLPPLVDTLRAAGLLVVFVRHTRLHAAGRPGADLPLVGDPAGDLVVVPAPGDVVVDAPAHDGFLDTPLDAILRAHGRDHLLFAGLAAETVVDSTLRNANDRGYECLTLSDACAPFDSVTGARTLASITMSGGIFGAVGTTAAAVAAYGTTLPPLASHQEISS
jgi:nicotinamidase-related amidase